MRKLLLFVLVLAAGLLVLRLFEPPTGPPPPPEGTVPVAPPPPEDAPTGLLPGGRGSYRRLVETEEGVRPVALRVEWESSSVAPDDPREVLFGGVTLTTYDEETGAVRLRLEAERGRAPFEPGDATELPRPGSPLVLEDVRLDVRAGVPFAPFVLRAPTVQVEHEARVVSTSAPVRLEGPGIVASGVGLEVEGLDERLALRREGVVTLTHEGRTATLGAAGPIEVRRLGEAPGRLEVRAREQAVLDLPTESAARLEADEIDLGLAEAGAGAEREVALREVEARGSVRFRRGGSVFEGGRASFELGPDGAPLEARLEEAPVASVRLEEGAVGLPGVAPEGPVSVRLEGAGPLVVDLRGTRRFTMGGPAEARASGAVLRAGGAIAGQLEGEAGARTAVLEATGGVDLRHGEQELATDALTARLTEDGAGARTLRAVAEGRSVVRGVTEEGRRFVLTSAGRLVAEQRGETWHVPEANQVDLTVLGEEPLHARADRVTDLDVDSLSLRAEGGVEVEGVEGSGRGDVLVARGLERFLLEGGPARRASFRSADLELEAASIERDGERLVATGDVEARLRASEETGTLRMRAGRLELERREEPLGGGGRVRVVTLDAAGAVDARLETPRETMTVLAGEIAGTRTSEIGADGAEVTARSALVARQVTEALLRGEDGSVSLAAERLELEAAEAGPRAEPEVVRAVATGRVRVETRPSAGERVRGSGERLELDDEGAVTLHGGEVEPAVVAGALPTGGAPFELRAERVRVQGERLDAVRPRLALEGIETGAEGGPMALTGRARELRATPAWLELEGEVHVEGTPAEEAAWTLDADLVRLEGRAALEEGESRLSSLDARGDVRIGVPSRGVFGRGERLEAEALSGTWLVSGNPAVIETPLFRGEAEWLEYDTVLGSPSQAGRGRLLPRTPLDEDAEAPDDDRSSRPATSDEALEFESWLTLAEPDSLVYFLQLPTFSATTTGELPFLPKGEVVVQATWAVLWLPRDPWRRLAEPPGVPEGVLEPPTPPPPVIEEGPASLFRRILATSYGDVVREVYLEGPVEMRVDEAIAARAEALYLDLVGGNGWIVQPSFVIPGELLGEESQELQVVADWARISEDGSYHVSRAIVTPCGYAEPHVAIATGELTVEPVVDEDTGEVGGFEFRLEDNRIELYDLVDVPLPNIGWSSDERYEPEWATIQLGNSARFGSFVSAGFGRPAGKLGEVMNDALGGDEDAYDARIDVEGSYLGSRGGLVDTGLSLESQQRYWWWMRLGTVYDTGDEDKGYVRVDPDDRDELRLWYRSRGRYALGREEWLDLALSLQSDPAVQSEFFEDEFENYEQRENFLHWRKGEDEWYFDATAKKRFQGFPTTIEELPSAGVYRGLASVGEIAGAPLLWRADARAAYLRRREGDPDVASPFGPLTPFPDGLGDREVTRFDSSHRLELPLWVGGALRAAPFVGGRFTAWDRGVDEDETPLRAEGRAGLRLSTLLWKDAGAAGSHVVAPFVEARASAVADEHEPVPFDAVEQPLDGAFVDAGVRASFFRGPERTLLDLDLHATETLDGPGEEGLRSVGGFARLDFEAFEADFELFHDGRYDPAEGLTRYALTSLAVRPTDRLAFEGRHQFGRDVLDAALYEAVSVGALWTWTPKWEFEGRETLSLRDDDRLGSEVILRRYGHDVILELETSFREGEGTSFGINVRPLFGWSRPKVGYVEE